MSRTCTIFGCLSRSGDLRLYSFTKKDDLRGMWLANVGDRELNSLSKPQLVNKFICQKHFESRYVHNNGDLTSDARPTLFTEEEISSGAPVGSSRFIVKGANLKNGHKRLFPENISSVDDPGIQSEQRPTLSTEEDVTLEAPVSSSRVIVQDANSKSDKKRSFPQNISSEDQPVRDKILKDEMAKVPRDKDDQSSNGSWYEACATAEDDTMVVPIRHRTGETFEIYHKKVISYDVHEQMRSRLTESEEAIDILKRKVHHLEDVLKMKDTRIEELQSQLSKKQTRSKESLVKFVDKPKDSIECSPSSEKLSGGQGDDTVITSASIFN